MTKEVERRLNVVETMMLRWTTGVRSLDRVLNDSIRKRFGVIPIFAKMREARLRWCYRALCSKDDTVGKIGVDLKVIIASSA